MNAVFAMTHEAPTRGRAASPPSRLVRFRSLLAGLAVLLAGGAAFAAGIDAKYPEVHKYFPAATRFGEISGTPPAAPVYQGERLVGYVFESRMVAPVPAYSGEPVDILVAIDTEGQIVGTRILEQHEPIFLIGIPVEKLYDFVARFVGHNIKQNITVGGGGGANTVSIDAISSATVTSMSINQTIVDSALKVAASRNLVSREALGRLATPAKVRMDYYRPATWQELRNGGAIGRLHVTHEMVAKAFGNQPGMVVDDTTQALEGGDSQKEFIDLYFADVTPPTVGRNLLGEQAYSSLLKRLEPGDEAIAVVANGSYSFKGIGYVRGGVFDRVQVVQGNSLILFHDSDFMPLVDTQLAGMPSFQEKAIFVIRHAFDLDPGTPWTLRLVVRRQVGPLKSIYTTFHSDYRIPADYVVRPQPPQASPFENAPVWARMWYRERFQIGILIAGLLGLSTLLVFQDWFVRRPVLLDRVRTGFLVYTLVFIGWYGLAQLSVVNIFTLLHAVFGDFHWSLFLMDPLIFVLWGFVALTLLLVGRGVYCGWLCPFGALQTLVNKTARRLGTPQLELPRRVHERLWVLKYVILLALFAVSLHSLNMEERFAEVEPFKTAIDLHFMRSWPFVVYALCLVAVSAFNSKFYCRYVCPLGAGLAVGGRFRMFDRLRRRPECGHPCRICANECEVQAIDRLGRINFNECHHCLDCQVTYWNSFKCPPLVHQRRRATKRGNENATQQGR